MKIQITKPGIYGSDGQPIPVGTELTVKAEPKGWKGRYTVVGKTEGKVAVAAPKVPVDPAKAELEAMDVDALKKMADDLKVDLKGASAKGDMIDALLKAAKA